MPCKTGTKKRSSFQETEAKSCESNKVPKKQSMQWRLVNGKLGVPSPENNDIASITKLLRYQMGNWAPLPRVFPQYHK